jgi:uncharacterized protein YcgL (UPF0745 family)
MFRNNLKKSFLIRKFAQKENFYSTLVNEVTIVEVGMWLKNGFSNPFFLYLLLIGPRDGLQNEKVNKFLKSLH